MSFTVSRRQFQPLQEYSEMSEFAYSGTASGHGTWVGFLSLAFFSVSHQVSRDFQEEMGLLLQCLGSHHPSDDHQILSITGVQDHEKNLFLGGRSVPTSSGVTQECDCCGSWVRAAQLVNHSHCR